MHLEHAFFDDADLRGGDFRDARLLETSFVGARLARSEFSATSDFAGSADPCDEKQWKAVSPPPLRTLTKVTFEPPSVLCGISFTEARLNDAEFDKDSLRNAGFDLARADRRVSFRGAHLGGAAFTNANLPFADFTGASLDRANMAGATPTYADFTGATMQSPAGCADFRGAHLLQANLTQKKPGT